MVHNLLSFILFIKKERFFNISDRETLISRDSLHTRVISEYYDLIILISIKAERN
jgi:hypothetical protein